MGVYDNSVVKGDALEATLREIKKKVTLASVEDVESIVTNYTPNE